MPYTDVKTGQLYPSKEWMMQNIQNLPEVQKAYPELMKPATEKQLPEAFAAKALETVQKIQTGITGLKEKMIEPEVPAGDLDIGAGDVGEIPTGRGGNLDAFNKSLQASLDASKKAYEDALKTQMDILAKQKADYETKISDLETKQEVMLEEDIKPLMEPFREKLETTERERLKIEENYFANQTSIGELNTLLTQGQAEIEAIRGTPGLAAIKTGQINKKAEDITARASIIQAVMSARSGQIHEGYNLIDRSVAAIEGDRKDQLSYYESVYNFYQEKKDTAGRKLITLEKDEKDYINQQISDLKQQQEIDQSVINQIKEAMLDPKMATIYEQAGVMLTDTPEEIQTKLSNYNYSQEIIGIRNEMEGQGFEYLPMGAGTKPAGEITTMTDSRGKTYTFWKKAEAEPEIGQGWANARQFIMDNPNASYAELYQGIKDNTNLPDDEIVKLLKDKEDIIEESKTLTKSQIVSAAQAMKADDVDNYFRARYTQEELGKMAKDAGFGAWNKSSKTEVKEYLASPIARTKLSELLEEQYVAQGYTIIE